MEIRRMYKYKLYRSQKNKHLHHQINQAGLIWNWCVAREREQYANGGAYLGHYANNIAVKDFRRELGVTLGSQAAQEVCKRVHLSYQRFFKWSKSRQGIRCSPPQFKKVKKYTSFTLSQAGWKYEGGNRIKIGKKWYKFALSRELPPCQIKTVTIKRDRRGGLYVIFSVIEDFKHQPEPATGQIGGFDFGLKTFLTDNLGDSYHAPQFYRDSLNELAKANRNLARKVKGSNNWYKARRRLAKTHERVANRRAAHHWWLAHHLCDKFDHIFLEDLNLSGMKKLWGRKVSDLGFYSFVQKLEWVAWKRGVDVHKVGRWTPTTQSCSRCGEKRHLELWEREYHCYSCGWTIDRDWNAAINICAEGASSAGLGNVRPQLIEAITVRPQESHLL